ncbi:MAG: hypothetical protein JO316_17890 [Abitibacteriaceae bacterium]|nr:hypothetical protein [Abditibacteriaceae bacterium]
MQEVTVTNFPAWTMYVVALSQIVFALAMIIIAGIMVKMVGQIISILQEVQNMVSEDVRRDMLPSISGTLKNVKTMSDDATSAVHNVTGTVNRVSHVVSSVSGRLESPLVRTVGLVTGLAAGARAVGGRKEKEVVITEKPKRRGLLGLFK